MLRYFVLCCGRVGKKIKTSINLDEDLLKWIESQIKTKRFANRTHAIEFCIEQVRKSADV
jgi:Arc/MetJ-type ribon-helix-helix transcriptional regulator